ncbi:MAG TPA: hypothetical protein VHP63_00485 [candidate division Zixibacteria bacterium]|nr:hypothetical protein [candidate division Zixibacteria bacterium]
MALLQILTSCSNRLYGPKMGITEKFYMQEGKITSYVKEYDFERLKKNKGIVVFSYEYRRFGEGAQTDSNSTLQIGVRVWEHSFSGGEQDIVDKPDTVLFWGRPDMVNFGLTKKGQAVIIQPRYHRGRIVYGGRLVIGPNEDREIEPMVEFHYDEDFLRWIRETDFDIKGTGIDTALMSIKYWKDW